ncbi:MarR family transcriptional regulator [Paenibacillus sp. 1011MAR3C5]|uniref:MarR family winged helix-turn-helix transcriptional regulator n=1 Tax=Paenibacillus sp. 1011MAR3C5 TaxID=1675787 RepID=UPI002697A9D3|nr:MarR family transcriptional regulator [Paenibacillus sp. 1011MAR3C5]
MVSNRSLETIEFELAVLIRRVMSINANKKGAKLDRAAYLLLHQISVQGSAGVKVLGEELQLDISTVSRQAAVLEQKGYVRKVPDAQDGRAYFYQITELGEADLHEYKQSRLASINRLVESWDEEERDQFGQLLMKFNQSLKHRTRPDNKA